MISFSISFLSSFQRNDLHNSSTTLLQPNTTTKIKGREIKRREIKGREIKGREIKRREMKRREIKGRNVEVGKFIDQM